MQAAGCLEQYEVAVHFILFQPACNAHITLLLTRQQLRNCCASTGDNFSDVVQQPITCTSHKSPDKNLQKAELVLILKVCEQCRVHVTLIGTVWS